MTTPTITEDLAALKAAIDAGPTPGPRFVKPADEWTTNDGHHAQWGAFNISAGSSNLASESYYRIGSVSNANNSLANSANAMLMAACDPDRIARLIAALREAREDAERYRWLTNDHGGSEARLNVFTVSESIPVRDKGATDAAIDAAMVRAARAATKGAA